MNTELLERNFGVQYPEELDGTLDLQNANASLCKFNRWGSMVAIGSTDGRIFVFDFITKGIVKTWTAHALPVTSLSWSRDGRTLLTGASDCTVVVWDVMTTAVVQKFKYSAFIVAAIFNPRNDKQILVLPLGFFPVVETLGNNDKDEKVSRVVSFDIPGAADDGVTAIAFDRRGEYLLTGTSKGRICVFDARSLTLSTHCRQNSAQQIRNIIIPKSGDFILTNSSDRVIRAYELDHLLESPRGATIEPQQKLLDIVNKAAWKSVCVSADGDYICGASTKAHSLYVWERNSGSLIKILHGTKASGEVLSDIQWHPTRPVILSVANGIVSVWTQAHVENWSAFAPEFTELEENAKYVEKEGEFDLDDEDADEERNDDGMDNLEDDIDVVSMRPTDILCSSDEEDDPSSLVPDVACNQGPLWYMPIAPEIESPDCITGPYPLDGLHRTGQIISPHDENVESRKRPLESSKPGPKPKKVK